jgi:hypothetical protein
MVRTTYQPIIYVWGSVMWSKIGIVFMWLVVVGELGGIGSELSVIERVLRNIESTTVAILNKAP